MMSLAYRAPLIQVMKAAQIVDSLKRKPEEYEVITFFGSGDIWEMHMVFDNRTCEVCAEHKGFYRGNILRAAFPYLEVIDADLIYAHVHPHCRCYLVRFTERRRLTEYQQAKMKNLRIEKRQQE